jgi:mRNA-degrading endonuclease RelE of RelBE toxin-antitoxin system
MKRALRYEGRILKDLKRLDSENQARILSALERFAATGDGDVRPLRGEFAGSYRIRVGKWRVYVLLEGKEIVAPTSFIGAWSIDDNGDIAPKWKIPVQQLTGYGPYSLAAS